MKRQTIFSLLIAVCLLITAVACSSGNVQEPPGSTANEAEGGSVKESATSDEKLTLYVHSNSGDSVESWNERFGNALKEKFPNYSIEYIPKTKEVGLKELITAGQRIDIFWESIGGFSTYLLGHDLQYDMSELIEKHEIDMTRFESTAVEAIKQISGENKIYGIPVFNNTMVMYYNKDLFDKFGVDYPTDGMTWTEAAELSKKLTRTEGDKIYAGLSSSETHMLLMNQLSIPFVDPKTQKATLDQDERWRQFYETVFVQPAVGPGYREYMQAHENKLPNRKDFLEAQDLAMFGWLSSIIFVFPEEFSKMNWDMVSMPTFDEAPGIGTQAYPTYFSVTNMAENKDAAMEVIKYLVSDEMQTSLSKMGVMPVINDEAIQKMFGEESMFRGKNFSAAFYNKFAPIPYKSEHDRKVVTPYAKAAPKVVLEGDFNTIFRTYAEESNQKITDTKTK
ncbi:ABC transporter substrate-binding protein [Paenibacillus alkalitolerans]|uniref:ABC transporter substrate-binding protein n=1 Tax=Paenibacillus alkalitolerans TaxID=2799335 RepID=UPI0018F5D769|nr:extracellular solute-binding protein [Paenibacillus alkalitolerans]